MGFQWDFNGISWDIYDAIPSGKLALCELENRHENGHETNLLNMVSFYNYVLNYRVINDWQ